MIRPSLNNWRSHERTSECIHVLLISLFALLEATLHAQTLPVNLLSQSYAVGGGYYDSASGQSNSYSFVGSQAIQGYVGYDSYDYERGQEIALSNYWSSAAGPLSISVNGSAAINSSDPVTGIDYAPYGTMDASAKWTFSLLNPGTNLLQLDISGGTIYADAIDSGAISISVERNSVIWDNAALDVTVPNINDNLWQASLKNSPGDIWQLSVQISEAAWNGDYTYAAVSPQILAVPEANSIQLFGVGFIFMCALMRLKQNRRRRQKISS